MKRITLCLVLLLVLSLPGCAKSNPANPDGSINFKTNIENKGSDTVVNLALAWAEAYQKEYAQVTISVTGGGTGAGLASLINHTTDIANASRRIKTEEIQNAVLNGVDPVEFVIARDAIAVIVHLDNPIDHLTMQQIADIYSGKYQNWRELGGDDRPIVRLSRETNSGTHVYFLEQVLKGGDPDNPTLFSADTLLLPSSEGIIAEVRENPNAIGYDGLGYVTEGVKLVAVSQEEGMPYILPSIQSVNDETYPIARELYMYTADEPEGIIKDYIDWILSAEAQEIVKRLGFVPVTPEQQTSIAVGGSS